MKWSHNAGQKEAILLKRIRFITIGGFLTALAVILQSAPVFLPAIGLLLSPFSTLPIIVAASNKLSLGLAVYFSSTLLLFFIYVQEAIIFSFTTGLLGLMIGTFLFRRGLIISILFSSIGLSLGMMALTYIIGLAAFKQLSSSFSHLLTLAIYFFFSLIYASIWNIVMHKTIKTKGRFL